MSLVAEGFDVHVPKGFIYFAIGFACFVEALNLRARRRRSRAPEPVHLRQRYVEEGDRPPAWRYDPERV